MSEKIKTAVMEVIKAHMDGEDKNTKAVLSDVMKSVNELILEQQPCEECKYKTFTELYFHIDPEMVEQEPCDKAISCSDMLDAIGHGTTYTSEELQRIITNLPPVNPKPCDDAISREKANQFLYERLDRLNDDELYDIFSKVIDDMYNELPSITPTQRWIPVSERMPKIAGIYRVTRYYPNNVMNPNYLVDACCFDGSNTWYDDNRINYDRAYADNVIAWQENPEPYKVEPQESE